MEKKKHRTKLKKVKVNQTSIGNDFFAHKVQKDCYVMNLKKWKQILTHKCLAA